MKRLDLIISAIEDALKDFATDSYDNDYHGCCGADLEVGHTADCKLAQAYAAARSLRELEPVGIRYNYFGMNTRAFDEELFKRLEKYPDSTPQKLYALGDEK